VSHSHAISPQADRQRSLAVLAAVRSSPLRPAVRLYSGTFGSVRPCQEHSAAPTRGTAPTGTPPGMYHMHQHPAGPAYPEQYHGALAQSGGLACLAARHAGL
jgi:hypothetical protein